MFNFDNLIHIYLSNRCTLPGSLHAVPTSINAGFMSMNLFILILSLAVVCATVRSFVIFARQTVGGGVVCPSGLTDVMSNFQLNNTFAFRKNHHMIPQQSFIHKARFSAAN